jgi:hypothetical protein
VAGLKHPALDIGPVPEVTAGKDLECFFGRVELRFDLGGRCTQG